MQSLRDVSWMKYLYAGTPAERFDWGRFRVATVIVPPSGSGERYRYRMFFFEAGLNAPVLAVNLESDLLGAWKLTREDASGRGVLASFDQAPSYETFRSMAVAALDRDLAPAQTGKDGTSPDKRTI
ncbi:MAG: hypothetical protein JW923_03690 [Spirochaetales bacterium]|nr:hypothetical protein [Spirochaetales bacterium]